MLPPFRGLSVERDGPHESILSACVFQQRRHILAREMERKRTGIHEKDCYVSRQLNAGSLAKMKHNWFILILPVRRRSRGFGRITMRHAKFVTARVARCAASRRWPLAMVYVGSKGRRRDWRIYWDFSKD